MKMVQADSGASLPGLRSPEQEFKFGTWYAIESAPRDGTRVLAVEGTDPQIIPIVVEWYNPTDDGYDGEPCWVHSEEVLSDMSDAIDPIMWTPIPRQDFGD